MSEPTARKQSSLSRQKPARTHELTNLLKNNTKATYQTNNTHNLNITSKNALERQIAAAVPRLLTWKNDNIRRAPGLRNFPLIAQDTFTKATETARFHCSPQLAATSSAFPVTYIIKLNGLVNGFADSSKRIFY